jgi:WD40 repeat protein
VRIWDANTGKEMLTIPLDSLPVACTFSPDGKRLAIARSTGLRAPMSQVLIHDAADGKELAAIPGLQAIKALCFSPDGSRLAGWGGIRITGVGGPTVQIWNAVTGAPLQTIKGLTAIHPIAFSGDGKQLHTLDHWSMLQTWAVADMPSEKTNVSRRIIEPSPDGRRFVEYVRNPFGGAEDGPVAKEIIVRDWDGREIKRFDEHAGSPISAAWSGDGKVVASIAFQPETELANCYVWEADTGRIRMEVKVTQRTLALSRDGGRLATRDRSGIVKVFDTRNGKEIFEAPVNSGIFLLSPDGRRVATAERSGKAFMPQMAKAAIQIWDVDARMEVFRDDNTFVGSLAFNRDGGKLAYSTQPTGTFTTLVKVRDAQTGAEAGSLMAPFIATKVVFSPDDKLLALHSSQIGGTSFQGVITLVDAASLKEVGRLEGRQGALAKVVFSPDGKRLASSTGRTVADPAEIRLWDLESRRELLSIKDVGLLEHLLFDHGGQRLIGTRSFFQSGERMTIWDGRPRAEAAK